MSEPLARGKVRDVYDVGDGHYVLVATDRISAYDVVLPTRIPGKGQVLTGLSALWFGETEGIVANHLVSTRLADLPADMRRHELAGRTMLVRRLEMLPVEVVVRGYLSGSGWREYRATGEVCGHRLPPGLTESSRLAEPILTPATKAVTGHDENITREQMADLIGAETAREVEEIALALYSHAGERCLRAGIILADTKFEMGHDADGRLTLGDEVVTPDSSRFWPADDWAPGGPQPSFDKQFVRDWLDGTGWNHLPPGPELPAEVVDGTRRRYEEAYERLTGHTLATWVKEQTE